jgi:hypothetical protein
MVHLFSPFPFSPLVLPVDVERLDSVTVLEQLDTNPLEAPRPICTSQSKDEKHKKSKFVSFRFKINQDCPTQDAKSSLH